MTQVIWFCGDTHGDLRHIERAFSRDPSVDVIVHVGDFDLTSPLSTLLSPAVRERFWWIPGNHDYDDELPMRCLFEDPLVEQCLHSRVVNVGGTRLAGLGATFKGRIWRPPEPQGYANPREYRQRTHPKCRLHDLNLAAAIWPDQVKHLASKRADILVLHEAPSSHRHGFSVLDQLALDMGASLVVHGHHHEDYEATINEGRTRVLGVGFRGITDQDGNRVVPGTRGNLSPPLRNPTGPQQGDSSEGDSG